MHVAVALQLNTSSYAAENGTTNAINIHKCPEQNAYTARDNTLH